MKNPASSNRRRAKRWAAVPLCMLLGAACGASADDFPFEAYLYRDFVVDARTLTARDAARSIAAHGDAALVAIRGDWRVTMLPPPGYAPDA